MSPSTPTEWKPAAPGTQLSPLPSNPYPYPMNAWDFVSIEKFDQGQAQVDCYHANQTLAADYISGPFTRFIASYSAGRLAPDAKPPAPPMALVVQAAGPSEDGSVGLDFDFVPGTTPVCDVPAYQHQPAPTPPP